MKPQLPEHALEILRSQVRNPLKSRQILRSLHFLPASSRSLHTSPSRKGPPPRKLPLFPLLPNIEGLEKQFERLKKDAIKLKKEAQRKRWLNKPPPNFAVLGGGITGLATAHYLLQELPHARVTIYEASDELGGWMKSTSVDVGNGNIIMEQGPRTLRPNTAAGLVTLEMIHDLGLTNHILKTSKTSASARNRFIYYPDHLVRMPGPGQGLFSIANTLSEEIFNGIIPGCFREVFKTRRPLDLEDESVGSFFERRFGPDLGNNLISAMLHGIYAGDLYKLSVKSLFPSLWHMEATDGSITKSAFSSMLKQQRGRETIRDFITRSDIVLKLMKAGLLQEMRDAEVYTLKGGLGTLVKTLESSLRDNENVRFKLKQKVTAIEYDYEGDAIKIKTSNQPPQKYTNAVSTLSSKTLSTLAPTPQSLPSLSKTPSVTVMVVNLYYRNPSVLPTSGFGYLIPRSIPFSQNPEFALGVIFDSDSSVGQDSVPGTKLTVMMGGHWWDTFSSYPDSDEGAAMAKSVLRRHLNITEEPEVVRVNLQKDCIPQYTVGHEQRMKRAHGELIREYKGKLAVVGNSYTGVGVNDCVRAAREVAIEIGLAMDETGLKKAFVDEKVWTVLGRLGRRRV